MGHGGKRKGAGRPKGINAYGESTKPVRIPLSRVGDVKRLLDSGSELFPPLYSCSVRAGFPSPAEDHIEDRLDLNEHLIEHPSATFFVRASGDSMNNAGIQSGDLLIVDRSIEAKHNHIVIAAIDGELTVKRLYCHEGHVQLRAENECYPSIEITSAQDLVIWGVVTYVVHQAS